METKPILAMIGGINEHIQVLSRAHAIAAVFRAVNDYMNNRLKSRNVHSEIVYSLNPTNSVCSTNEHSHLIIELTELDCGLFSQVRHSGLHQGPVGSESLRLPGDNS